MSQSPVAFFYAVFAISLATIIGVLSDWDGWTVSVVFIAVIVMYILHEKEANK